MRTTVCGDIPLEERGMQLRVVVVVAAVVVVLQRQCLCH